MNYPFFTVPLIGGGLLIGAVAVVHIFVSHFAIGGGLFLVLAEKKTRSRGDTAFLSYLKFHSLVFIMLTLVLGALTGVGIWFTIGLVHPDATSALIHIFVFGWAIEWVFFLLEIASAILYYYTWDRIGAKEHLFIGWVYFVTAFMSLVVINGILSFMLTPGRWLETRSFWDGFFNPTYLPSLLLRIFVCMNLAGLYAMLTGSLQKDQELRKRIVRYSSKWLMPSFAGMPIAGLWYMAMVPALSRKLVFGAAPVLTLFFATSLGLSFLILLFVYLCGYRKPESLSTCFAVLLLILSFLVTGTGEWLREALRKPFIIYDYMYSNSLYKDDDPSASVLERARWVKTKSLDEPISAGREVFRAECGICHTHHGYNGIMPLISGWEDAEFASHELAHLNRIKEFMPPFMGTREEREALASYLMHLKRVCEESENLISVHFAKPPFAPRDVEEIYPPPDPNGLPAPAWLLKLLHNLTFILHLLPMGLVLGGGFVALAYSLSKSENSRRLSRSLYIVIPVALAGTVTLGIPPLLFTQVLYGQAFYTSTILMGWFWLGGLGLLSLAYYGFYADSEAPEKLGRWALPIALLSALFTAFMGLMLTKNISLILNPERWWRDYYYTVGISLHASDWRAVVRYTHFFVGSFALVGAYVMLCGLRALRTEEPYGCWLIQQGKLLFLIPTLINFFVGALFLLSFRVEVRGLLLGANPGGTVVLWLGALLALIASLLTLSRSTKIALYLPVILLVIVVLMSVVRSITNSAVIEKQIELSSFAVQPQPTVIALFFVLLVAGVVTLVITLRKAFPRA